MENITVVQQHCNNRIGKGKNKTWIGVHVDLKIMNEQLGFPQKRKHSCKHAPRTGAVNN